MIKGGISLLVPLFSCVHRVSVYLHFPMKAPRLYCFTGFCGKALAVG